MPGGFLRASFVAGALREISVGVGRGNFLFYRGGVGVLPCASEPRFRGGLHVPIEDLVAKLVAAPPQVFLTCIVPL
jgi:hypothetical protein